MLFHSVDFALFFAVVFAAYWFVVPKTATAQNVFLVVASYFFYATWDWYFLGLLIFSTASNFVIANFIHRSNSRNWLILGIFVNLSLLGFFKYHAFFVTGFHEVFSIFGTHFNQSTLQIILPVGISFYTFQNVAYLVDVYQKHQLPSTNYLEFSLFVSFFPQLISGPIPKASQLFPQLSKLREFQYSKGADGLKLIVLGLFEKMVIGDTCALTVNSIYADVSNQSGSTLFCAAILFSFQIYGDFSGYSHMAIGCAKLLGFDLHKNFNYPYLAKNIADFWRRWHITFSIWLRDYIYIPLGGNRKGEVVQMRNLLIVFLVSGLWHGATLNFAVYGLIHGSLYVIYILYRKSFLGKMDVGGWVSKITDVIAFAATFAVLTLARVFFRSETFASAIEQFSTIFSSSIFSKPNVSRLLMVVVFAFLFLEWLQRNRQHLLDLSSIRSRRLRFAIYFCVIFAVFYFGAESQKFIYNRF